MGKTIYRNRTAMVPLSVPSVPSRPGETLQARLTIVANGNQRFIVPVVLEILGEPLPVNRVTTTSDTTEVWVPPLPDVEADSAYEVPTLAPEGILDDELTTLPPTRIEPQEELSLLEPWDADEPAAGRSIWPLFVAIALIVVVLFLAAAIKEVLTRKRSKQNEHTNEAAPALVEDLGCAAG